MRIAAMLLLSALAVAQSTVVIIRHRASSACGNGFAHCRSITWASSQAGTANSATFPGLVNATNAGWKTVGNGGSVQNTVSQSGGSFTGTIPADFIFATSSACTTPVTGWEFENYSASTGAVLAWVNIGTLSSSSNTAIWACYGKSSVTTQQHTVSSTWDSNYWGVWHFAGSLDLHDSTSNGRTLSVRLAPTSGTGYFGNGAALSGNDAFLIASSSLGANTVTMEILAFSASMTGANMILVEKDPVNTQWLIMDASGTFKVRGGDGGVNDVNGASSLSNSTWYSLGGTITGTSGASYIGGVSATGTIGSFTDTSDQFSIGEYDGGGQLFTGTVDEVRVSKTARAASYFTARWNQEKPSQTMVTIGAEQ